MSEKTVTLQLSTHELELLASALNEALEAVEEWEFETRLGASRAEAREFQKRLRDMVANIRAASPRRVGQS